MTELFSRISMKRFIALVIIFFILVFSGIATLVTYNYAINTFINSYIDGYTKSIFAEIEQSFISVKNQLNNISLNLLSSSEINSVINNENLPQEIREEQLNDIFDNIITNDSYIGAIDFISTGGKRFRYGDTAIETVADENDFMDKLSNMQLYIKNSCKRIGDDYYLPIGKKIYNYSAGVDMGFIIFYVDESALGSLYSEFDTSRNIFFISVDEVIVSHPNKKYVNTLLYMPQEMFNENSYKNYDNSGYSVYENYIEEPSVINNIKISGVISNKFLFSTMNRITSIILMIFVIILLFSAMFSVIFSKNLIWHITALNKDMAEFARNHTISERVHEDNEIIELEESFSSMTRQINELISKIEIEKEKQKIMEINFLQAQINPHFIYNALDAISWKAKINKQNEIDDMIINLATFFRVGLHKGENIISVNDELCHVKSYIKIEKNRFNNSFDVNFELEEGILAKNIVKVILQPVVENSIIHGFKNIDYRGRIIIRAYMQSGDIMFEVEDNGCGVELHDDASLPVSKEKSGGYGLYNVNKRLQMYYGEGYGLTFNSVPYEHTIVKIRLKDKFNSEGDKI